MNHFSFFRTGPLVAAASLLIMAVNADAQQSPSMDFNDPSVTVDLSVIKDSGYGPAGRAAAPSLNQPYKYRGKLLVPGDRAPTSMLYVTPVGGAAAARSSVPRSSLARSSLARSSLARSSLARSSEIRKHAAKPVLRRVPVAKHKAVAMAEPKAAPKAAPAPAPKKLAAPVVVAAVPEAKFAPPPPTIAAAVPEAEIAPPAQAQGKAANTKKRETEVASLPPPAPPVRIKIEPGMALQVVFANDATRLSGKAKSKLKSLAEKIKGRDNIRLQLMAYAGGDKLTASLARRLSLSRALSVRSYLIESGIRSTRIDVRALGSKTKKKPFNRVDLDITER